MRISKTQIRRHGLIRDFDHFDGRSMSSHKDWSDCMDGRTDFECSLYVHAKLYIKYAEYGLTF